MLACQSGESRLSYLENDLISSHSFTERNSVSMVLEGQNTSSVDEKKSRIRLVIVDHLGGIGFSG